MGQKSLNQIRIGKLRRSMSTKATYVFKDSGVVETMSTIHNKYVVVPADKDRPYLQRTLH